jgi:S-adenosyl methyltransferase
MGDILGRIRRRGRKESTVLHRPAWAPDEIDIERPAPARMYDYYLGGSHNFAADRQLAEANLQVWPDLAAICQANRAFLHRSVRYLAAQAGIGQFLDLGSGIPSIGNVHEVAAAVDPASVTVYVDADPVAFAHGEMMLRDDPHTAIIHADLRDPQGVLSDPVVTRYMDLSQPVAVVMNSVLPFVPDEDDPAAVVAAFREATAPGSYLVLSHATSDYRPERATRTQGIYAKASHTATFRSRTQIEALMDGYELVEPGLVDVINWRPDPDAGPDRLGGDVTRYSLLAAVGRRG